MCKKAWKIAAVIGVMLALSVCMTASYAYQVPNHNTNVKYFYVFGKDGDPLMGAEDSKLELFIDVPADGAQPLRIRVYDPDVGGRHDWRKPDNDWNTSTKFEFYGSKLLDSKTFGNDEEYDNTFYQFGPYDKSQGEKVGNFYRFRLVATGLNGDDENLFKVDISPDSAESFVENITFRLLPHQGDKMYFYPQVPAGTASITVENYDLDINGGSSTISVTDISEKFPINDSESGEWRHTVIPLSVSTPGRLTYIITKATQRYANAGIRMEDDKGNAIPIYFRKGTVPVSKPAPAPAPKPAPRPASKPDLKCNKFTFDATSSYDIDRQNLSFLWNFGDGETSTEPVVTHIYEKAGEYNVTLTVTDDSGLPCDSAMTSQKIYVNTPPSAAFSVPGMACVEDTVNFDASATTDDTIENVTYMWNFGDGDSADGKKASHKYSRGGSYKVTLAVNDNSGTACDMDSVQKLIKVNTPPVADAGRDISKCLKSIDEEYNIMFDGSASRDADGDMLTYMWNFGDGGSAEGKSVSHIYAKGGTYKVTLSVDDGVGSSCSKSSDAIMVDLNKPPVAVSGDNIKTCVGKTVSFDGSASRVEAGGALSYDWSFGDGSKAEGAKVTHSYSEGGRYNVMLTVDDGKGTPCSVSKDTLTVDVNSKPSASLKSVEDICVREKVSFDASGSKDPDGDSLKYSWNFGDGTTESGSSRTHHAYDKGGLYNVTVTVDDGQGSSCSASSDGIKVKVNTPPIAKIDIVKACCVGMEQKFDASGSSDADGDALSYRWDFGDGETAEGAKVTHVYSEPGTYEVMLGVNDGSGTECSYDATSSVIVVNAKPVPIIKIR